jgi:Alanine racemase
MMQVRILNLETVIHPPAWAEIDLKALAYNFEQLKKLAAKNMSHAAGIMTIIKADAYGHGMLQVAQALGDAGCKYFGVSNVAEAVTLRAAGFKQRSCCLNPH